MSDTEADTGQTVEHIGGNMEEKEDIRRMLAALYIEAGKCKSKAQILALIWEVITSL